MTLIPDTKFFCKPQSDKYVTLSTDSFDNLTQTNTLVSSLNNTNSVFLLDSNSSADSSSSSELSKSPKNSDTIIASIMVISDNFYGYKPINDSYISLKTKSNVT
jgi:hypothetical protein